MDLKYEYQGVAYSITSIMNFVGEGQSDFWSAPLFYFYTDIDKEKFQNMEVIQQRKYLEEYFSEFEKANRNMIKEKVERYNERWKKYCGQIREALEEAFEINLADKFNAMKGYVTYNPVCPRYLENSSFDVFYLNSEKGALGLSIHEIIHFVWFYVWKQIFLDDSKEYETPHMKWILSEMVVEPIMRDERLASINPYFEAGECVYPYFYSMRIEGKPILECLAEMYGCMTIKDFMKESYYFCQKHETEIRRYIQEQEV